MWQKSAVSKLETELQQAREKNSQIDGLRAENERLSQEKVDASELQRLRDNQTELLRLRAQVSQLKREVQEAKAAATTPQAITHEPDVTRENEQPVNLPIQTYAANVNARVGWKQALVVGGWKTPSGKRELLFFQAEPGEAMQR